ncbi:MAG: hypothetical protein GF333_07660 [Candidatus Omnitrophica bacterium]|nr:hypothetical protein [Candidatus Omnitrophota bacterium]
MKRKCRFTERIPRTPQVTSFRFEPLEGRFEYKPGQFATVMFDPEHPRNRELNKYLSFSCAAVHPYVEVTKKMSGSAFSRSLSELRPGDSVWFEGPRGRCVFEDSMSKTSFLIGGIGITPVISVIEHVIHHRLSCELKLFYSNRTERDIAFKAELDRWSDRADQLRVFHTLTDCASSPGYCREGRIGQGWIREYAPDIEDHTVFLFGPPAMVSAMEGLCRELGCPPDKIKKENFTGY